MSTRSSLGSTELADVDKCDRLYDWKHVQGLTPLKSKRGQMVGTLLHVYLRYWYAQFRPGGPPPWWYRISCEDEVLRVGVGHNEYIDIARMLWTLYYQKFAEEDQKWKILNVEDEFTLHPSLLRSLNPSDAERLNWKTIEQAAQGPNYSNPSVRFDLVVEREDGAQFVTDWKSTLGQWGKLPQWSRDNEWSRAWQPHEYYAIASKLRLPDGSLRYPRLKGFIIQRIQSIEPFTMDRNFIAFKADDLALMPQVILRQLAKRIVLRRQLASGAFGQSGPLPSNFSCWQRYGQCDFWSVCQADRANRQTTINRFYSKEDDTGL